ncbi:hypothetical protein QYF36_009304 [Acer negundo]|nr:hypothetical protein QYF36_009304 [Acer negundo]
MGDYMRRPSIGYGSQSSKPTSKDYVLGGLGLEPPETGDYMRRPSIGHGSRSRNLLQKTMSLVGWDWR